MKFPFSIFDFFLQKRRKWWWWGSGEGGRGRRSEGEHSHTGPTHMQKLTQKHTKQTQHKKQTNTHTHASASFPHSSMDNIQQAQHTGRSFCGAATQWFGSLGNTTQVGKLLCGFRWFCLSDSPGATTRAVCGWPAISSGLTPKDLGSPRDFSLTVESCTTRSVHTDRP